VVRHFDIAAIRRVFLTKVNVKYRKINRQNQLDEALVWETI